MERLHARGEQELNLALNELGALEARVGESHRWIESAKAALEGSSCREPAELVALMADGRRLGLALPEMQQLAQSLKESEWAEQAQAAVDVLRTIDGNTGAWGKPDSPSRCPFSRRPGERVPCMIFSCAPHFVWVEPQPQLASRSRVTRRAMSSLRHRCPRLW